MSERMLQSVLLENRGGDPLEVRAWRVVIGCMMLNQTTRKQVDQIWPKFFCYWPDPVSVIDTRGVWTEETRMYAVIHKLGFGQLRMRRFQRFSDEWLRYCIDHKTIPESIIDMYGCGKYAEDSYQLFVKGDWDVQPTDKELIRYMEEGALED
jgi:adenine-specific DNA glycosylase